MFGIALGLWGGYEIDKTSENAKSFSELLLSDEEKENQIAKLDVTHVPYQFAVQDGNDNSYYIVMDEDYIKSAVCPRCGKHTIELVPKNTTKNMASVFLSWILGSFAVSPENVYQCSSCKYESETLPESFHNDRPTRRARY